MATLGAFYLNMDRFGDYYQQTTTAILTTFKLLFGVVHGSKYRNFSEMQIFFLIFGTTNLKSTQLDIVIPLAANSYTDNLELRFALRSIQKYLSDFRQVFIIGRKPEWIKEVVHKPINEYAGDRFKDMNMRKKIMYACSLPELSDEFLYFHDDHFLLKSVRAPRFPIHHKGLLQDTLKIITMRNPYRDVVMNTIKMLVAKGKPTVDYDTHCPMIIDKKKFVDETSSVDHNKPFVIKSMYGNIVGIEGEFYRDCKIKSHISKAEISALIKDRMYFSTSERALGPDMIEVFNVLYPKKSKFEIK